MKGDRKVASEYTIGTTVIALLVAGLTILSLTEGVRSGERRSPVTALLVIDVQAFYFPGGFLPLQDPERAAGNCGKLLERFRDDGRLVVHVGHNASKDKEFHPDVEPSRGEKVFYKDEVSAFNGTGLLPYLRERGVERLVICGMMTHMCVEAAVRAAHDLGFECVLVGDACATRDLEYAGDTISASDVHNATLATLDGAYATVVDTKTFLEAF